MADRAYVCGAASDENLSAFLIVECAERPGAEPGLFVVRMSAWRDLQPAEILSGPPRGSFR